MIHKLLHILLLLPICLSAQEKVLPKKQKILMAGITAGFAPVWNFAQGASPSVSTLLNLKLECFTFTEKQDKIFPVYSYNSMVFRVPVQSSKTFYYQATEFSWALNIGMGFVLYQNRKNNSGWLALMNLAISVDVYNFLGQRHKELFVQEYSPWFSGSVGVLLEFRSIYSIKDTLHIGFGLGVEYIGPESWYNYRLINSNMPKSIGSVAITPSFFLAF